MNSPEDMLFALPDHPRDKVDIEVFSQQIAAAADTRPVPQSKPLSPAFADLGYRRRETLSADIPRSTAPRHTYPKKPIGHIVHGPTDGDLDPNMRGPTEWKSAEQVAKYAIGAAKARAQLPKSKS